MIEIMFSESGAATLKAAQNADGKGAVIGVIITNQDGALPTEQQLEQAQKTAQQQWQNDWQGAKPLGGNPDDVFCFDLAWDMGDITEDGIGEKRLAVLNALYSIYDDDTQKSAKIQYDKAQQDFERVMQRVQSGEDVRIWYCDNPAERCGMLWFMAQLRTVADSIGKVYTVKLPKYTFNEADNIITDYHGWAEVPPAQWHRFAQYSQDKTKEYWGYAQQWWNLQRNSTNLRAVLNGRVHNVSEDIYDCYIWQEIDLMDDEFIQAYVVGNVLAKHHLGIGDAFVALRMETLIESNILQVVPKTSRGPCIYHRKLKKCY